MHKNISIQLVFKKNQLLGVEEGRRSSGSHLSDGRRRQWGGSMRLLSAEASVQF